MDKNNTVDVKKAFEKKLKQIFALAQYKATEALQTAQQLQDTGQLARGSRAGLKTDAMGWVNQTEQAIRGIRGYAHRDEKSIVWGLFHTVSYGVQLELANNRKYELLRPVIASEKKEYIKAVKEVMGIK
ncbi:MAG: hypothetical protein LBQ37_02475 [Elusimicrobiota bacterium]|jgi:hypothetical protein|nr:hypothetical protein [Elusimicrobiota bacterium]